MDKRFALPRGTNDILPDAASTWQRLETTARKIMETYGYKEIRTPVFEETNLFSRSLGLTSDIVQKQMLSLQKEGLSLRPEGTAPIVRAYIENSLDKKQSLAKLYYFGAMFRGERPQKGRLRQFNQIGVEAIGPNSRFPYLDAEVIALSVNILKSLGLDNFQLKINTLGSPKDKENYSKLLREKLKGLESQLCDDCVRRLKQNVFRVLDCKNKVCRGIIEKLQVGYSYLSKESSAYFEQVKTALNDLDISFEVCPKLVRGLDYYTDTVFEICDSSLGSQDALGAGGRYNNLVKQLGGPDVDAIGFALGIERILLALPDKQTETASPLGVYIIALGDSFFKKAFQILNILRENGITSDMSYKISSVKSLMRSADKSGAKYAIIIGEDEIKNEKATLREMASGTQEQIPFDIIVQVIKDKLC